ncbi:MAG: cell division protein SepF [Candidatus Eremiobacteraeota bacterium]|nr:cell division protein SepF [Candidatus Eremiobacteraeota bacterium]
MHDDDDAELHEQRGGKVSVLHKIGSFFSLHEDDEMDDAFEDETATAPAAPKRNVVSFSSREKRSSSSGGEVSLFAPRTFGDVTVIADALRSRQVVIVNLQGVDRGLLQRVVDFTSGVAYTLDGKIQKLADAMYLVVPPGTPVNSDGIKETLATDPSFDFMSNRG